jgi:metallo-beta-lactamase family protein
VPDEKSTIIFVGYQAAGTIGRKILDGHREVSIFKQMIPVRCRVERIGGFSAHADYGEVLHWLAGMPSAPRRSFTTHGEPDAARAMAEHIKQKLGWRVDAPEYGEKVELE